LGGEFRKTNNAADQQEQRDHFQIVK